MTDVGNTNIGGSLLPSRILPETAAIGTVNEDGSVTISHDWWLLIYNLCRNALNLGRTEAETIGNDVFLLRDYIPQNSLPDDANVTLHADIFSPRSSVPANSLPDHANQVLLGLFNPHNFVPQGSLPDQAQQIMQSRVFRQR